MPNILAQTPFSRANCRLVLIGEDPEPPYERPHLSKEFIRGEQTPAPDQRASQPHEREGWLRCSWEAYDGRDSGIIVVVMTGH